MAAPWRKVVRVDRTNRNDSRRLHIINYLECGHWLKYSGERAHDAQYAERRRCKECDDPS